MSYQSSGIAHTGLQCTVYSVQFRMFHIEGMFKSTSTTEGRNGGADIYKTKVESAQLGKPPTEPRVLRKVCVVVVVGGG